MTIVSVAEACGRLGIDAKTLHRWLADAYLPLHNHPGDGRKKGVSEESLQRLARLHQRCLAGSEEALPSADPFTVWPAALLALPHHLAQLSAQLTALQQQVTALSQQIASSQPVLAHPLAPALPPKPARPAPRPAPAKTPAKPVHVIPRVEYTYEERYVVICPKRGILSIEPDTDAWLAWVAEQDSFRFVGKGGHFTAHHEWRVPKGAWRAHRKIRNRTHILRLAPNQELTIAVLEQAAATLQARLS